MRLRWLTLILPATAFILVGGCFDAPVASPKTTVTQVVPINVPQTKENKVDVLFMVDNSPSMDAMQSQLRAHFKDFLQVFQDLATKGIYADLHIGVITSDYGAGRGAQNSGCDPSPGGQRGLLQALGAAAQPGCQAPAGSPYISYAFGPSGPTSNLPAGQDLATTFTCMASVGLAGCGFEHQLESTYAALRNTKENAGFLRDDAFLAVVFVTNEDDGSAPPDTHIYDGTTSPLLGAFTTFRQTRWAVACGGALPPYGASAPLMSCASAPAALQAQALMSLSPDDANYDLQRYITFFTAPQAQGGIKDDPAHEVVLVGLTGPSTPFQILLAQTGSGNGKAPSPSYVPCSPISDQCIVALQHSCQNHTDPAFFADPGVRMNAVINAAPLHEIDSICGDDLDQAPDYTAVMIKVANLIKDHIGDGCIPAPLTDPNNPDCTVEDVTPTASGDQETEIPRCDQANGAYPCWKVEMKSDCAGLSPAGVGITIERNGMDPPKGTFAQVSCSTIAVSPDMK